MSGKWGHVLARELFRQYSVSSYFLLSTISSLNNHINWTYHALKQSCQSEKKGISVFWYALAVQIRIRSTVAVASSLSLMWDSREIVWPGLICIYMTDSCS